MHSIINYCKDIIRRIMGEIPTRTLKKRGMKVGKKFNRQQGCFIDPTHCWLISIGDNVTFSIRVTLLAHDASMQKILGYVKLGRIDIGNNVFIGANSTILLGVKIGDNSIVGANSVVTKDVPPNTVVAGNPARVIYSLEEFHKKEEELFKNARKFSEKYIMTNISEEEKKEMQQALQEKIGYIL